MVLIRLCFLRMAVIGMLCLLTGNAAHAQDFSELNRTFYLRPLTDDSLKYAWELYRQSLEIRKKDYPSLCFELSEEAERIFQQKLKGADLSKQNLETMLRALEISLSRNRPLIDKDEESSLHVANLFNLLKVGVNLVQVKTILDTRFEPSDSLLPFYTHWFQQCKTRYLRDYCLYRIKKGELQEALSACREALELIPLHDSIFRKEVVLEEQLVRYLMRPFPKDAERTIQGLKELASPVFTKNEILRAQTLPLFYLCAIQVARIYEANGNMEQARHTYQLLLTEIRNCLSPELPYLLAEEREEIGNLLQYYLDTVQNFTLRHLEQVSIGELLFDHSLLKEDLLAVTSSPVCQSSLGHHPAIRNWQASIDSIIFSPDYYLLPGNPRYFHTFQLRVRLLELKRKQVALVKESAISCLLPAQVEDWQKMRSRLKPHEALVRIIDLPINFFNRQYLALVLTPQSASPGLVLLPKKRELLRIQFQNQTTDRIWQPIQQLLGQQQTEIYLCLDGELIDFPWNTIPYRGKTLLDAYRLHHLLSTKDFVRLKQEDISDNTSRQRHLYGFGGAYFSQPPSRKGVRGQGVQYLPGSREELCSVDSLLPETWESHLFLGSEANKTNFLGLSFHMPPHSIIHIATHGFSLTHDEQVPDGRIVSFSENPIVGSSAYEDPMMRNGFLLTGANRYWNKPVPYEATDSGIVTAQDVSEMNLSGTDLVVLSACRSGSGETKDGEGMFGLIRAFKQAGAHAVLANLNNIADKETVLFVTTFYRHWIGNGNLFDAFRETQRELICRQPELSGMWSSFILFE